MKKIITIIALLIATTAAYSQNVQRDEKGNFITVRSIKQKPVSTTYTYTDSKGIVYPVYMTATGRYFVFRVSRNTGKEYRYYLTEAPSDKP